MTEQKTNPNGANQYHLDPRQKLCWENYINPESDTFGNATQSAIKAGYTEGTANQITTFDWFIGKLRRLNMRSKAEEVLKEMIEMDDAQQVIVDGRVLKVKKRDPALTKIKQDTAKFVSERLSKDEWSQRSELTGKDGSELVPTDEKTKENIDKAINEYLEQIKGDTEQRDDGGEESAVPVQPAEQPGDGAAEVQPLD